MFTVSDVMTTNPVTLQESDELGFAESMFQLNRCRHLPVLALLGLCIGGFGRIRPGRFFERLQLDACPACRTARTVALMLFRQLKSPLLSLMDVCYRPF